MEKQKNEFDNAGGKAMQWLTNKSSDMVRVIAEVKKLEELLRDMGWDNGFLPLISVVPMKQLSFKTEKEWILRKMGIPLGSTYPTEKDLLNSVELYEAKIIWFMSEEAGMMRDRDEGPSISGEGKVGERKRVAKNGPHNCVASNLSLRSLQVRKPFSRL